MAQELIKKPEIPPQKPSEWSMDEVKRFIKNEGIFLAIGIGIIAIIMLSVTAYRSQQRSAADKSMQMLSVAKNTQQMEELLTQYPSSPAAPIAMLALASQHYLAGAYDQARGVYLQFLEKYPKHPMALTAEMGKIACMEARGEFEQALIAYSAFIDAHADHFLVPQAMFGKARCLQNLKRYAEARVVYEDYIVAHPDSDWKPRVEMALHDIERTLRASGSTPSKPPVPPAK